MSSLGSANAIAGPSSAGQGTSMKRKSAAGKACLNCRRRKSRCNGLPPTCQTCEAYNDECIWGTDDDARKPASRQYVNALQQRIKVLEAALKDSRQGIPSPMGVGEGEEEEVGAEQEEYEGLTATMLHLHMSDAGEDVHYHGPTSAYAHATHVPVLSASPATSKLNESSDRPHDYRLFLPRTVELSHVQHSTILDRFFRFFSSWGLRVSPQLFMQDMIRTVMLPPNTPPARFSHYSPFLHNIILAIALMWADEPHLCNAVTRSIFAEHAERYLSAELARPTLATVQGLALKSSLHSTLGDHTSGWAYFGMAERVCLSLGLNVNCTDLVTAGKMSAAEMQYRQHTFWTVFVQEQCWAVYIGRPHVAQDYTIPLPTPDPALDEIPWTWHTLNVPDRKLPPQPSMYGTAFAETAKLTVIMQRVMSTFYSPKSDGRTHNEQKVSELSIALQSWSEALPSSLVITGHSQKNALPHIIVLQLAKEWLTILIYRPYYRALAGHRSDASTNILDTAVTRCDRSADRINTLLRVYHTRFGLRYTPPTVFNIAFMAGSTHLLAAVWHRTASVKAAALQQASECVTFLRHVAESWPAAGHKADILQALVTDYAEPAKPSPNSIRTQPKGKVKPPAAESSANAISVSPIASVRQAMPIPTPPVPAPTPGGLDWFASLVQNQGVNTQWETQLTNQRLPEGVGTSTFAQSNPIDTSSNYLQSLIAMLNSDTTSPAITSNTSPINTLDVNQNWLTSGFVTPSMPLQPFDPNNAVSPQIWSETTLSSFRTTPPQDPNLPWTFDFS